MHSFDPKINRGRKTIYVPTQFQGIRSVWDWDSARDKYVRRSSGHSACYYSFKKVSRRQYSACFPDFESAKAWRESPRLAPSSKQSEIVFGEALDKFFEHKKSKVRESSLLLYRGYAPSLSMLNGLPVRDIDGKMIDRWLQELKKPEYLKSQHPTRMTFSNELTLLRQVLSYVADYLDEGYQVPIKKRHREDAVIDRNRYLQAKLRHRKKYIPRQEFEAFLEKLRSEVARPDLRAMFVVALMQLRTGLRVGEACALNYADVNFTTGQIEIAKTVVWKRRKGQTTYIQPSTKTGEPRTVIGTADLLRELLALKKAQGRSDGLIFSENGITPVGYRSVQYRYNKALKSIKSSFTSTQVMRHSYATDFMETTSQPLALKALLGHRQLQQTEHYGKTTERSAKAGFDAYQESLNLVPFEPSGCDRLGSAGNASDEKICAKVEAL